MGFFRSRSLSLAGAESRNSASAEQPLVSSPLVCCSVGGKWRFLWARVERCKDPLSIAHFLESVLD